MPAITSPGATTTAVGVTATVWGPDAAAIGAAAAINAASIPRGRIARHPNRGQPRRFRTARAAPATDARPARCYYRGLLGSAEFCGLLDSIPRPDAPQTRRILFASLIGTTIEFFDFYIYATAAVLVFPKLFFPKGDPATAMLQSLATFALAFFARPIGSALFGHFGDRIGRKATLVPALLTMGISTVCIGLLPTYASIGVWAAGLLALCRIGQGVGLGGEWGGAVLLATENAPPGKQAWYGCFPQLGAPLGFLCSTGVFLLMSNHLTETQLLSWGWRVPFLASAALVLVGLYVRLQLVETPAFLRSVAQGERVRVPFAVAFAKFPRRLVLGTLGATTVFVVFYLMTVFALGWATG